MRNFPNSIPFSTVAATALLGILAAGCGGGGGSLSSAEQRNAGNFQLLSSNMQNGMVWELNRSIMLQFNHPVDMATVNFSTIQIRPTDQEIIGRPVTGEFVLEAGSSGKTLIFRPACPTNEENDNGGLLPGGYNYELTVPTQDNFGATVVRDRSGHPLSKGMSLSFRTPNSAEPYFLDDRPTAPAIVSVEFPESLNFFSEPDGTIDIQFDQSIDGRSLNLNTNNLYVLYSDDTATNYGGNPTNAVYPGTNKLPGVLVLVENCSEGGSLVQFQIAGLLPPDRYLKLVMEDSFTDIIGQSNLTDFEWVPHQTPTLADVYQDPTWQESDETVDEFSDHFMNTQWLDPGAELPLPPANVEDGNASASFEFPGQFVNPDSDFYFDETYGEIFTDGQTVFTDSNNRTFTVQNGVLYCDDFEITSGSTMRGRGRNPLVIYATGEVTISGSLNVSGNHSHWPTSLNSPQFPEGGALGECGGGNGGTSSQEGLKETLRAESGDGPFGLFGVGGQGGEGGYQQDNFHGSSYVTKGMRQISGGGGGGTFSMVPNSAIVWTKWIGEEKPNNYDNAGPDHSDSRHPFYGPNATDHFHIVGGEDGVRGSSFESDNYAPGGWDDRQQGVFGMEDRLVDTDAFDGDDINNPKEYLDPACDQPGCPDWQPGHPTLGPDGGTAGPSVFSADGDTGNDFWGRRFDPKTGSFVVGELLAPWAGSGGGGSGDTQRLVRKDLDGIPGIDPLNNFFPDRPFLTNTSWYYKGAPGGGGGGQLLIMAIGKIKLGSNARVLAKGGIGHAAESIIYTYNQISGAGGGSGGHIVVHSATEIDLSSISIGSTSDINDLVDLIEDGPSHQDNFRAFGGRRGWCLSDGTRVVGSGQKDGNPDFMVGRGGAGGDGVIQFHVPNPLEDFKWNNSNRSTIESFISPGGVLDLERLEAVLDIYSQPKPYVLVPFFASGSQFQSKWIDTGLAFMRLDPQNTTDVYPNFSDANKVMFQGTDLGTGSVLKSQQVIDRLPAIVSGNTSGATFAANQLRIPSANVMFAGIEHFLRHPNLLMGYDIMPDNVGTASFEIVAATYNSASGELVLDTLTSDGSMVSALNAGNPNWDIVPKYFRIETSGIKDGLPNTADVVFEFQGAEESAPGSNEPGTPIPGLSVWTKDLSDLQGMRFIRYRVSFEINANNSGLSLNSPRPHLEYVKLPFTW